MQRRAFIRTAMATLALPAFESLRPAVAAAVSPVHAFPSVATKGKRLVCIGNSFGMYQPNFFPEESGRDYKITPTLEPLQRHRSDFSVFSNLDHGIKGGHYAVHSFLSGVKSSQSGAMPDGNITIDQRAAEVLGRFTRFPALTIGSAGGLHGGCQMSWTRSGVRVPPIEGPRELFRKLFLNVTDKEQAAVADSFHLHGSILDAALGDAKRMSRTLSRRDDEKLKEFFSSVRDVEKEIQQKEKWLTMAKPDAPIDEPVNESLLSDIPNLFKLIALALETDSTRVTTLELAGAQFRTDLLGLQKGYHAYSHHGKNPENIAGLKTLELYQMEQFASFLDQLKAIKVADGGTLLDETAILFGSGMGNANSHSNTNLPIIVAGGGLLSQPSVLTVSANGVDTSPIVRGVWILENILGTPPNPPPPDIEPLDPDTRGTKTIRDLLAKHRTDATCAVCHRKIDPLGFALENFDAIGQWRKRYRNKGGMIDATGTLPGGKEFKTFPEFKKLLLQEHEKVARAITKKAFSYALGRSVEISDRPEIDSILDDLKKNDWKFRYLIRRIVLSPAFQKP